LDAPCSNTVGRATLTPVGIQPDSHLEIDASMTQPTETHATTADGVPAGSATERRGPSNRDYVEQADDQITISRRVQALKLDKGEFSDGGLLAGRRRWLLVLALGAAAVGAPLGWRVLQERFGVGLLGRACEVDSVTAATEPSVGVALDLTGYLVASELAKVSSSIPGTICEVTVDEGERVSADQLLGRLEDAHYRAELEQAKANLAKARAQLEEALHGSRAEDIARARALLDQAKARRDLCAAESERAKQMQDSISSSELERLEANRLEADAQVEEFSHALRVVELGPRQEQIAALRAEVDQAQASVDKAEYFVDCTRLQAPVSGTVIEHSAELGEAVLPESMVTTLFVIADLTRLEVEIDIQEQDLARVRIGQPCVISAEAIPGREYQGRLDWFSPVLNRQRGVCQAKVEIADPDEKLKPDMSCRVRILEKESPGGLTYAIHLPPEAIVRESDGTYVFVLDGRVARRRAVEIGHQGDRGVEIRRGLNSGEIVLLAHDDSLSDGQEVRLRE
jgi:HlyD family secretion protein